MSSRRAAGIQVLVVLAGCGALAACAGSGLRLPECRGTAVPINSAAAAPMSGGEVTEGLRAPPVPGKAGAGDVD
jgi:hypothetical protein